MAARRGLCRAVDIVPAPGNARVWRGRRRRASGRGRSMRPPRHLSCYVSSSPTGPIPPPVRFPRALQPPRADWPQSSVLASASRRRHVRPARSQPSNGPGLGAAVREPPANRRSWRRSGCRGLFQGRCQPRRLQVRDRAERAGPSSSCAGSRSRRYSSRSPSPRAMSRRSLRSAKNRRRGAGWSRTHSVYMNCPMHQHAPNATLPATSVHHTTAKTSHTAFPSCCHASPYGFPYLTSPTSSRGGRTRGIAITRR